MEYRDILKTRNEIGKQITRLDDYKELLDRRIRSSVGEKRLKLKEESCKVQKKKEDLKKQYNFWNAMLKQEKEKKNKKNNIENSNNNISNSNGLHR